MIPTGVTLSVFTLSIPASYFLTVLKFDKKKAQLVIVSEISVRVTGPAVSSASRGKGTCFYFFYFTTDFTFTCVFSFSFISLISILSLFSLSLGDDTK